MCDYTWSQLSTTLPHRSTHTKHIHTISLQNKFMRERERETEKESVARASEEPVCCSHLCAAGQELWCCCAVHVGAEASFKVVKVLADALDCHKEQRSTDGVACVDQCHEIQRLCRNIVDLVQFESCFGRQLQIA